MKAGWMLGMAVLVTAPAARGEADCALGQITVPGLSTLYDPFDATFQPFSRIATLHTAGDCSGASVQLSLAPTPYSPQVGQKVLLRRGNGATLAATVTINNHATPVTTPGGAFAANPLPLQSGSSGEISLNLDLDPGQIAPPGYYDAQLLLQVSAVSNGRPQHLESRLNIGVNVKPSTRLATGSGNLSIDLGELSAGTIGGPVSFDAYSNVDYILSMHSDHGFLLISQQHGNRGIPYEAILQDAVDVTTTKGTQPLIKARFTAPPTGLRHHWLRVKVDPFSNLGAGQYSDVLTVKISAQI